MLETGYRKPFDLFVLEDKEEIVNVIATYHTIVKVKAIIDQFMCGLQCLSSMHEAIKYYPDLMKPLFVHDNKQLSSGL